MPSPGLVAWVQLIALIVLTISVIIVLVPLVKLLHRKAKFNGECKKCPDGTWDCMPPYCEGPDKYQYLGNLDVNPTGPLPSWAASGPGIYKVWLKNGRVAKYQPPGVTYPPP